jgi:hypothetical protein
MENLNGIRGIFKKSKKLNRRFHSLPFRKLQTIIEYKALHEGIEVRYLTKKETKEYFEEHATDAGMLPKLGAESLGVQNVEWSMTET